MNYLRTLLANTDQATKDRARHATEDGNMWATITDLSINEASGTVQSKHWKGSKRKVQTLEEHVYHVRVTPYGVECTCPALKYYGPGQHQKSGRITACKHAALLCATAIGHDIQLQQAAA